MRRIACALIALGLAAGGATMLRADDSTPPPSDAPPTADGTAAYVWYIEHYTYIAKDPEAMGVAAVGKAAEMLKADGQTPEQQVEFFTKVLYMTKSHAVERTVRMQLVELYKQTGQDDKAMEQLQELMTEQP
ncbi:MAG: hypothetical protein ABSG31_17990 [Tepidisphaeraceae bacterium]|jgi:hypothetical protein